MLYACDDTWWAMHYAETATRFRGERWTISARSRDRYDIHWVYGIDKPGLSKVTDHIHTGKNSGHQAVALAAYFGAKKILLLGFDFCRSGGKSHWHGDHPPGLGNGGKFANWVKHMGTVAPDAKKMGIEVINCSRRTAINCFPSMTIGEALNGLNGNYRFEQPGDDHQNAPRVQAADLAGASLG